MDSLRFSNLFSASYWFSQPFVATSDVFWAWVVIFLALILLGLVALFVSRFAKDAIGKNVLARVSPFGVTIGLFGLLWLFFRQERVAFLAWRFWLILLFVVALVWAWKIVYFIVKRVPVIKKEKEERALQEKYAPGKR